MVGTNEDGDRSLLSHRNKQRLSLVVSLKGADGQRLLIGGLAAVRAGKEKTTMSVKPKPDGYHSVTPYLIVRGAARAIEFYEQAFGAVERFRMPGPGGRVGHAEIAIGDSCVMLADEVPEMGYVGPEAAGGTPVTFLIYVEDVDNRFANALAAGATEVQPVEDKFWGDRTGQLRDPFGHLWTLATHVEDVPPDEIERRAAKVMQQHCDG
jgi:PhnB protein